MQFSECLISSEMSEIDTHTITMPKFDIFSLLHLIMIKTQISMSHKMKMPESTGNIFILGKKSVASVSALLVDLT